MTSAYQTTTHWLAENKDTLLWLLQLVPWREVLLYAFLGAFVGLLVGLLIAFVLHKTRLLQRNTRWLNIVVKINWFLIPALLAFTGLQIGIVRCTTNTADKIVVSNEAIIRDYTHAFLGQIQTQLDRLIEQNPNLKDTSLDNLLDTAIDQAVEKLPETSAVTLESATYVYAWFKTTARSAIVRSALKTALMKAAQKVSGADTSTVEMAFGKTLGQMADNNIAYTFARDRIRKLHWSLITAVLLHTLPFLLIPAAEISISKWRKW